MRMTRKLSAFVSTRIDEHPDADEAEALRELWNMAHDQVDITMPFGWPPKRLPSMAPDFPNVPRQYVPGEVKNERALRDLASQWADHPDYQTGKRRD
jgi:hypothetical protein